MAMIPAGANEDLWVILGVMVAGSFALQWSAARASGDPGEIVADCGDGAVIGVRGVQVRRRPGRTREQRAKLAAAYSDLPPLVRRTIATVTLKPGELSVARVRREPGADPEWKLEALNDDRDRVDVEWNFESENEAHAALDALNRLIVRAPVDENGTSIAVTEADLDAVIERERLEEEQEEQPPDDAQG